MRPLVGSNFIHCTLAQRSGWPQNIHQLIWWPNRMTKRLKQQCHGLIQIYHFQEELGSQYDIFTQQHRLSPWEPIANTAAQWRWISIFKEDGAATQSLTSNALSRTTTNCWWMKTNAPSTGTEAMIKPNGLHLSKHPEVIKLRWCVLPHCALFIIEEAKIERSSVVAVVHSVRSL